MALNKSVHCDTALVVQSQMAAANAPDDKLPRNLWSDGANTLLHFGIDGNRSPEQMPLASLRIVDRPRLRGENAAHTMQLAATDGELPPIVVHRPSLRVIDGVHRVYAALMRGMETIDGHFFDGSLEDAFVLAVSLNVRHGLALTLPDRRAAAARILKTHPQWSDRAVASCSGLSATTVSGLRRATVDFTQSNVRIGRDGRSRPVDSAIGRQAAADYLMAHPGSSLRTVAKVAGVSPGTVKSVRDRLSQGLDPMDADGSASGVQTDSSLATDDRQVPPESLLDTRQLLDSLARDPSVRMSEAGRALLRWLFSHAVDGTDPMEMLQAIPNHSRPLLIDFADRCAHNWAMLSRMFRCE